MLTRVLGRSSLIGAAGRLARAGAWSLNYARAVATTNRLVPFVIVRVTDRCNGACRLCSFAGQRRGDDLPYEFAAARIPEFARAGALLLAWTGGEALLHERFVDMVALAGAHGLRSHLCTNGTLVDASMARRLQQAGLRSVSVSLDHPDPVANRALRGGLDTDRVMRGIEALRTSAPVIRVAVGMTISRVNLADVPAMCRRVAELDVRYLKLQPYHEHLDQGGRADGPHRPEALTADDWPRIREMLDAVERAARVHSLRTNVQLLRSQFLNSLRSARTLPCVAGRWILHFDPRGRVGACPDHLFEVDWSRAGLQDVLRDPRLGIAARCPHRAGCLDTTYGELSQLVHGGLDATTLRELWIRYRSWL